MKKLSVPVVVVVVVALWALMGLVRIPKVASEQPDIYGFGQLPVLLDGRIQPIDSTEPHHTGNFASHIKLADAVAVMLFAKRITGRLAGLRF